MRLDKYLKVSRILKRRTVANQLAANQRVTINGKTAKPSTEVKIGDEVEITYGERVLKVRILAVSENVRKNDAAGMYEVIEETYVREDLES